MSLLESAVLAARAAGTIQLRRAGSFTVSDKGAADISTDVDHACEAAIAAIIRERHPEHALLAEEGTESNRGAPWLWLVDPLDGTKNYAHGQPRSCVAIAVAQHGKPVVGVVFNPSTGELFTAESGKGAALNGAPIHVSSTPRLARAMVASSIPYDPDPTVRRPHRPSVERVLRVHSVAEALRSFGCCALDLCDVARGRLDAYFEGGLGPWDWAAGALIVEEAGGRVTTYDGAPHDPFGADTLASNGKIHEELVALMRP